MSSAFQDLHSSAMEETLHKYQSYVLDKIREATEQNSQWHRDAVVVTLWTDDYGRHCIESNEGHILTNL